MEYADVLRRRRMVRDYLPKDVPAEVIDRVAGVVSRAPSAGFSQGHRLIVVTDQPTRQQIAVIAEEEYYTARGWPAWISGAPAHLVLGVCEDDYHRRYTQPDKLENGQEMRWPAPYWYVDAGALLMLIQLTAIDEGLGTGFLTVRDAPALRRLLRIPDEIAVVGLVTLGYPAPASKDTTERLRRLRKPLGELVRHGGWDPPSAAGAAPEP